MASETLNRIVKHKNVIGLIVANSEGIILKTTMDNSTSVQHINLIAPLFARARSVVRDLDPSNDLQFLRIKSKVNEIMVTSENDHLLLVVQALPEAQAIQRD